MLLVKLVLTQEAPTTKSATKYSAQAYRRQQLRVKFNRVINGGGFGGLALIACNAKAFVKVITEEC